jgi:hypothetical protein
MVAPGPRPVNDRELLHVVGRADDDSKRRLGIWLVLLAGLLLVGHPLNLALSASTAIDALPLRGFTLGAVLVVRLIVAAVGVGAGVALLGRRPGAATFARWALILSAATDLFVYATPYYPSNRPPGVTPIVGTVSMLYHGAWLIYLARSTRVRLLFDE